MNGTRVRRSMAMILSGAMLVAACGGSDDDAASGATATTAAPATSATSAAAETTAAPGATTAAPAATTAAPDDPEDTDAGSGLAANRAVVTIGDSRYEYDVELNVVGRCEPDFFGAFWVIASPVDGSGGLEMFLVPEGNANHDETSRVQVNLKDTEERDWRADADGGQGTPAGVSSVDSFTVDGKTVSGTASFVDIYTGDGATAQGTFEASCP